MVGTSPGAFAPDAFAHPTTHPLSPDAAQRVALAERCAAEPGPSRTPAFGTIPVLRSSTSCCIAPGKRRAGPRAGSPRSRAAAFDRIGRIVEAGGRGMARGDQAIDQRFVL